MRQRPLELTTCDGGRFSALDKSVTRQFLTSNTELTRVTSPNGLAALSIADPNCRIRLTDSHESAKTMLDPDQVGGAG